MRLCAPLALFVSAIACAPPLCSSVVTGLLSFDVLIPPGSSPGVNAFDVYDFTGPSYGPIAGVPYASEALMFDNTVLTLILLDGSSQIFDLGDLSPGELLDGGNPVVQVPSTAEFTSASLTATLSPAEFSLSNGSDFSASPLIDVTLLPTSGDLLTAGNDATPIEAEPAGTATPEPPTAVLLSLGALLVAVRRWR